jgi:hypothetical protein
MKSSTSAILIVFIILMYRLLAKSQPPGIAFEPYTSEQLRTERMIYKDGDNFKTASMYDMAFPPGTIMMWWDSGSTNETGVPPGWILCNGQNGTPDLRNRFPLGWNAATDGTRPMDSKGGAETVTLSIQQMPSHNHTIQAMIRQGSNVCDNGNTRSPPDTWNWATRNVDNAGGGQPHENMPPFMVIKYIMKQ